MTLPITATLQVRRRHAYSEDAHGNPIVTFGAPQDWPVFALQPGANEDPTRTGRDLSRIEWTVYAPADTRLPGEDDRVLVDGVEFEVEGRPRDWTRGPWPHPTAGVVVELRRVEG